MKEIRPLKITPADQGWDLFDGKSFNSWVRVLFPPELLKLIMDYKKKTFKVFDQKTRKIVRKTGKRAPVWTAFDKPLNLDFDEKKDKLPPISATFKFCFDDKYSAIFENLGMRVALELDMPTSYNYLVSVDLSPISENDSEETKQIKTYLKKFINNIPSFSQREKIQPIGIISIDFLQAREDKFVEGEEVSYTPRDEEGNIIGPKTSIPSATTFDGDILYSFEDALKRYHLAYDTLSGEQNLIANWIEVVDQFARKEFKNMPREKLNKMINDIHSRIARSFLLKDCILGDCDFTAYNAGIVVNKHKMRYAANYDYGDICNGLVKNILRDQPTGLSKEDFDKLPPAVQQHLLAVQKRQQPKDITSVARQWASASSEENFYYVLKNFPEACEEFFINLDELVKKNGVDKIVNTYTELTCHGKPLFSKDEAAKTKEYLSERIAHYCQLYVKYLQTGHQEIPTDTDVGECEDEFDLV